jgi:hypothetical protein
MVDLPIVGAVLLFKLSDFIRFAYFINATLEKGGAFMKFLWGFSVLSRRKISYFRKNTVPSRFFRSESPVINFARNSRAVA